MPMALLQQNVINTLLLYTANYTMPKCQQGDGCSIRKCTETYATIWRRQPTLGLLLCVKKASQPYSITVYKTAPLEDKKDKRKSRGKRGGRAGRQRKKHQKQQPQTFGVRTPASGKESCPGKSAEEITKALWTHCIALFPKQELSFIGGSITLNFHYRVYQCNSRLMHRLKLM